MNLPPETPRDESVPQAVPPGPRVPLVSRRWFRAMLLALLFVAGVVVGVASAVLVIHGRVVTALQHPERIPDRILPLIRRRLHLTEDQAEKVEAIVRQRHAALETIRAETTPRIANELKSLRAEVSAVLTPDQQARWTLWCDAVEQRISPQTND